MLAEEINALPECVRQFIHDIETRCDPAGDVRTMVVLREHAAALEERLRKITRLVGDIVYLGEVTLTSEVGRALVVAALREWLENERTD